MIRPMINDIIVFVNCFSKEMYDFGFKNVFCAGFLFSIPSRVRRNSGFLWGRRASSDRVCFRGVLEFACFFGGFFSGVYWAFCLLGRSWAPAVFERSAVTGRISLPNIFSGALRLVLLLRRISFAAFR